MKLTPISDLDAEMLNGGFTPVRNEASGKCMPEPSYKALAKNMNVGTPGFVLQYGCDGGGGGGGGGGLIG